MAVKVGAILAGILICIYCYLYFTDNEDDDNTMNYA